MPAINLSVPQISGTFLPDGTASTAVDVQRLEPWKSFQFYIEDTATLRLQGSIDGSNWVALNADVESSSIINLVTSVSWVRVYVVGNSAGATSCHLCSRDPSGS